MALRSNAVGSPTPITRAPSSCAHGQHHAHSPLIHNAFERTETRSRDRFHVPVVRGVGARFVEPPRCQVRQGRRPSFNTNPNSVFIDPWLKTPEFIIAEFIKNQFKPFINCLCLLLGKTNTLRLWTAEMNL
jgi:hypothetical protein